MPITAKPKKTTAKDVNQANDQEPTIDEKKAIAFINQGGSTAAKPLEEDDVQKGVIVRMYSDMIEEIDTLLKSIPKRKRPSRNAWIIQAIEDKLKKDKKHQK
jgi:hypothetical protein